MDDNLVANTQLLNKVIEVAENAEAPQSCIQQLENSERNSEAVIQEVGKIESKKEDRPFTIDKHSYIITGADLISRKVTEMPTLMQPFLPQAGIAVMAGSSDTGKSAWLRQLAMAVALNLHEFIGCKLNLKHCSAIYVSTEDDDNSIAYLIQKQNVEGRAADEFKNLRYIFETEQLLTRLDEQLKSQAADIVVIDTLTDLFGTGDFNNSTAVKAFFKPYKKLALQHQCLIIFNHHLSKAKEHAVPSKNAVLGSMAIE